MLSARTSFSPLSLDSLAGENVYFFVGFAHYVCFVVSTMTSRRLSIDSVYSSSTAAAPTAEFLGKDDRDFFGELDELESGDSVTLEEVSSSGRAQSLPSDSGVDLGGDEEGVSLSELETSLQESVSRAARARSIGSSDTCEDHFVDPDLDREKVREAHSAQKCSCREQRNCLKSVQTGRDNQVETEYDGDDKR